MHPLSYRLYFIYCCQWVCWPYFSGLSPSSDFEKQCNNISISHLLWMKEQDLKGECCIFIFEFLNIFIQTHTLPSWSTTNSVIQLTRSAARNVTFTQQHCPAISPGKISPVCCSHRYFVDRLSEEMSGFPGWPFVAELHENSLARFKETDIILGLVGHFIIMNVTWCNELAWNTKFNEVKHSYWNKRHPSIRFL